MAGTESCGREAPPVDMVFARPSGDHLSVELLVTRNAAILHLLTLEPRQALYMGRRIIDLACASLDRRCIAGGREWPGT